MYRTDIRFNHIQALRFFAALLVVSGHSMIFFNIKHPGIIDPAMVDYFGWSGGWSVSLFFAISGFVITHSSIGRSPLQFIIARCLRIYPAFWLACLLCAAIKIYLFGGLSWAAEGYTLKSLSLLPVGTVPYPLRIEWSLIYEVLFYVVFAISMIFVQGKHLLWIAIGWLIIIVAAALSGFGYSDRYPWAAWALVSERNLPFIAGVIVYFFAEHPQVRRQHAFLPMWALATALFGQITHSDFGIIATQAVSAAFLLTWVAQRDVSNPMRADNMLVKFGDGSYGLYLLHITIISVALEIWKGSPYWPITLMSIFVFGLGFGLMFGAGEQTLYKHLRRLSPILAAKATGDGSDEYRRVRWRWM